MCGIVGSFGPPGSRPSWLEQACESLRHRGPDGSGLWFEPRHGIGIGQTRLAIQDLSDAGRQPMSSACGRYCIVFNGEIYNHFELREALPPMAWRGHSDTETLLACLVEWGIEKTLAATVGMFAFGLFDLHERRLILARDRFGEKPLYCGYAGQAFLFGSELRALRRAPGFDATIDRTSLALYMRHSCVPGTRSIYSAFGKVPPGCWLEVTSEHIERRALAQPRPYWSAEGAAAASERDLLKVDDAEAVEELGRVLGRAVRGQMLSDVPLGAFLSGGLDSSTIVSLMQAQATQPVRTFCIGFTESSHDESVYAREVARHLGTDHTELLVRAEDALALVPRMPQVYDEPFADSSQLPTFLVAQLARRDVTVALSGDAGDELFAGYQHYSMASRTWSRISRLPVGLRAAAATVVRATSARRLSQLATLAHPLTPRHLRSDMAGDRLHKAADVLACRSTEEVYRRLVSYWWMQPLVLGLAPSAAAPGSRWSTDAQALRQMMLLDTIEYLPDDILVKVDRAAMAVSLETRVPLLDHRVFEFAWRLPVQMKVREGRGKWLLRQLLHRHVPAALVERRKMGFSIPLASWLRGPLREWAESLLNEGRLKQEGFLDPRLVRRRWDDHVAGVRNWQHELWNVLMFQAWLTEQQR